MGDELLEGFAVSGEYVDNLTDKRAIVVKVPHYEEKPDLDNEGKTIRKLVMSIELSDKAIMEYYPNKTSLKEMGNMWGVILKNWLAKRFEFEVTTQKVRGETKKVLYAKPISQNEKKI